MRCVCGILKLINCAISTTSEGRVIKGNERSAMLTASSMASLDEIRNSTLFNIKSACQRNITWIGGLDRALFIHIMPSL